MNTMIQKWGNSQGIRLPKNLLNSISWMEKDNIEIKVEDNRIILEKIVETDSMTIREMFAEYDANGGEEVSIAEFDWGEPRGKEIW